MQLGNGSHGRPSGYLGSDKPGGPVEDLGALGTLSLVINPKLGEEHFRMGEITTDIDTRYADKLQARVSQLELNESCHLLL
jgi:hypothetical protein